MILLYKTQYMNCSRIMFFALALCCSSVAFSEDKVAVDNVLNAIESQAPTNFSAGIVQVEDVVVNDKKKTIEVKCNSALGDRSFSAQDVEQIMQSIKSVLPQKYEKYKLKVTAKGIDINDLVLFADRKVVGPKEKTRFITPVNGVKAPAGLEGNNIAMWQSHGWYFEPELNRWEWQRARIFQTVEDLYTQSYVMPFLMPMLQNAGAYVISPRDRDTNINEVIVDADGGYAQNGYSETSGKYDWSDASMTGFGYKKNILEDNDNPFRMGTLRMVNTVRNADEVSVAKWAAEIPERGEYAVYVSYSSLPNSATDATYRINSLAGTSEFKVNQRMGGGTWIYLGHFPLAKGKSDKPVVELLNLSKDKKAVVTADAVKIGGGMGNVARKVNDRNDIEYKYVQSGYPRFTEAARYWLQWAGVPDSIYSPSGNIDDYGDDYKCRGMWVNYLTGGSSMLPKRDGLKIPIDLSLAFHTDAGTTMNDSIIGTLSIYYSDGNGKYANGTERMASRDYTDAVVTNIVNDIRAAYEPKWMRRAMWDKTYFEARTPQVPAMLLELLSHQNFADMKYGLDPTFRFTVSRAIYKGMLQYIAKRDNRPYIVQPLPVRAFEISAAGNGVYNLSWKETVDTLEKTATPTYYIVQHRLNDGAFVDYKVVDTPSLSVEISDNDIHSYRVIAGNDGGVSFPSEVLALCDNGDNQSPILVVNGFTRVSGPDTFDAGRIAGFNDQCDHGVPYLNDISFIGSQIEFRRHIPWMDDDAAGFGASRADYETKVIAGNTFDYVYNHGKAIVAAGRSFISSSVEAYMNSTDNSSKIVDLILGKQKEIIVGRGVYGSRYKTFPEALQQKITAHCNAGGNIFVSGSYVATDLWDNERATESDRKFAADVLGYKWRVGQASITGEAYEVQSKFPQFSNLQFTFSNELNSDCYAVESPDSFYPSDKSKGATILRYSENNLVAGTAFDAGVYRTVVMGFPFETIKNVDSQNELMKQVINFFEQ